MFKRSLSRIQWCMGSQAELVLLRVLSRYKSTHSRNSATLDRLKKTKMPNSLVHDELSYLKGLSSSRPAGRVEPIIPNDTYVLCTVFDSKGNVTAVSRKYPKMQFLKDNKLYPRDLRKIDSSSIDVVPSIMIKNQAVLVNLLHIKAIIKRDQVMVFDTLTPAVAQRLGLFMYDLEMKLKLPAVASGNIPYELRALESILINVMSYLESELRLMKATCLQILAELEDQVDRNRLQELLIRLKSLQSFYQRALLIRDVLEDLLDNDEDLAGMYLSNAPGAQPSNFEEVEMILESYYNQSDEIVQQTGSLINDIKATEEIVNIILDTNRNSMMLFELKLTVYTLGFGVATLVPAFYGMNLKNYVEESVYGFGAVVVISILQGILMIIFMNRKLNAVQKITMMNNEHHQPVGLFTQWRKKMRLHNHSKLYKLVYGSRNTKYHYPTSKDKDVLWRMINDDKHKK